MLVESAPHFGVHALGVRRDAFHHQHSAAGPVTLVLHDLVAVAGLRGGVPAARGGPGTPLKIGPIAVPHHECVPPTPAKSRRYDSHEGSPWKPASSARRAFATPSLARAPRSSAP